MPITYCEICDNYIDLDEDPLHEERCSEKPKKSYHRKSYNGKNNPNYKHGMCGTRQYRIWAAMRKRCSNKNDTAYKHYGGRGISVCDKWMSFSGFWDDMRSGYKDDLSIDRVDNDGNYELKNCRWVTTKEQSRNNNGNRNITIGGITKILIDWVKYFDISRDTFYYRIYKKKMSDVEALLTPIDQKKKMASLSRKIFEVEHIEICKEDK